MSANSVNFTVNSGAVETTSFSKRCQVFCPKNSTFSGHLGAGLRGAFLVPQ
jgi:hypothetical protein